MVTLINISSALDDFIFTSESITDIQLSNQPINQNTFCVALMSLYIWLLRVGCSVCTPHDKPLRSELSQNLDGHKKQAAVLPQRNRTMRSVRILLTATQLYKNHLSESLQYLRHIESHSVGNSMSRYNRRLPGSDLHTGATIHLWRATVHP